MGFLDDRVGGAHSRQKGAVLSEAAKAGMTVMAVLDCFEGGSAASAIGGSLKSLIGGSVRSDGFQVFQLATHGVMHLFVQPYEGFGPLPGEHHVWMHGSLRSPVAFCDSTFSRGWKAGNDKELAKWLDRQPALSEAVRHLEWESKSGFTTIRLPWALQIRPIGQARSHLVMWAGRYGGLTTHDVGFDVFLRAAGAVASILVQGTDVPAQPFLEPAAFGTLFEAVAFGGLRLDDGIAGPSPAAPTPAPRDHSQTIRSVLAPFEGSRLHVATIPPSKADNVRKHVLPPQSPDTIVAIIDLTAMGSAKDAIVLTPTHVHVKSLDDRFVFALDDVRGVERSGVLGGKIRLEVARLGAIQIEGGDRPEAIETLLRAIIAST